LVTSEMFFRGASMAGLMQGAGRMAWLSATNLFGAWIVFDMLASAPDHESLGRKGIGNHYDFIIGTFLSSQTWLEEAFVTGHDRRVIRRKRKM